MSENLRLCILDLGDRRSPTYRGKAKGMNLDTKGGHVLLLEFTR